MSKRTMKCPDCGAQIPHGAAMCGRCGYRPTVERAHDEPRKLREGAPRPVETSRWPDMESYEEAAAERKDAAAGKNIWQIAIVIALIVVIIVIGVILIIKMNAPAPDKGVETPPQESQTFEEVINDNVHVITGGDLENTQNPVSTDAPQQEPQPEDEPEAEPEPTAEPEATPVPTEEPDFPQDPSITISEMNDTVYVSANGVNLRLGPGTEYNAVSSLSRGKELKRTGVTNNGWSQVEWDGEKAYLSNTYVTEEKPEAQVTDKNDTVYVTGEGVNLRKGAGTDYDAITSLAKGTELKRTGETDNGWSRVEYNGETGYLSSKYISTEKPETPSEKEDNVTAKDGTVVVITAANLRTEPNESADVIAIANADVELKRTGVTDNGWTRVEYDGKTAYVYSTLLKDKDTSGITEESGTLTVTTRANIRSAPNTDGSILATVDAGTTLTKTGKTADNWFRITYNDQTGYIAGSLVAQG